MAKNTITEDDLLAGVGGLATFNQLGTGKPIRDTPFRDTRQAEPMPQPQPQIVTETKIIDNIAPAPIPQSAAPQSRPQLVQQSRPKVELAPKAQPKLSEPKIEPKKTKKERKSDLYGEKISTFLSTEMRDDLSKTARMLTSNRLVKGDPITTHTLMRCGVRVVTELLEFSNVDVISSEEELYALIKKKLQNFSLQ